jgi:hypothetical protein
LDDLRQVVARRDLLTLTVGCFLTLAATLAALHSGPVLGLGALVAMLLLLAATACFLVAPHVAVALTIPLFAFIPAAKVFVSPWIGPSKDVVVLGAGAAVALRLLQREGRREAGRADKGILVAVFLLVSLYFLDLGGVAYGPGLGKAWLQGVRLVTEPLILLLAGLLLGRPRKTLRWAATSLVATGCVVAFYGILQQVVGAPRLHSLGYSYSKQLATTSGGHLRSFGTLDDPFVYAAFLLFALATVMFWARKTTPWVLAGLLIAGGIAASLVHTAAVAMGALAALWIIRAGRPAAGFVLFCALVTTGVVLALVSTNATRTGSVYAGSGGSGSNLYLTLNGRTTVWRTIFKDPRKVPLGLGVGAVGTAALRANIGITSVSGSQPSTKNGQFAVDSGYFATIADVGLVGFAVFLFLMVRLVTAARAASKVPGGEAGWLCIAYLTVLLIDAITRDSFTGFPTAFLGLLMVGISLATAREGAAERAPAPSFAGRSSPARREARSRPRPAPA